MIAVISQAAAFGTCATLNAAQSFAAKQKRLTYLDRNKQKRGNCEHTFKPEAFEEAYLHFCIL
ncbi:hypothetical protein [Rhizobium binxianense]